MNQAIKLPEFVANSLAYAAIVSSGVMPAIVYFLVGFFGAQQLAIQDSRIQAKHVSRIIANNPDGWRFAHERLIDQVLGIQRAKTSTRLLDNDAKDIVGLVGDPCAQFCVSAQSELKDFGETVGTLIVDSDISELVATSGAFAFFGLGISILLTIIFKTKILHPLLKTRILNEELAFHDALTGVANRRLLMDRLGHSIHSSQRANKAGALLFLDLDNFKVLNDTLGHDAGDCLLVAVAERLKVCVRQEDTIARLGGDEFSVMLQDLSIDERTAASQAELVAEKIRTMLSKPYVVTAGGLSHRCTVSIGIALFSDAQQNTELLFKQADLALYQAKSAGKNAVRFFNPEMQAAMTAHAAMESSLRQAIELGELSLFYQPQLDLNGKLIGAEALVRWPTNSGETISPGEFVPLAEDTGLIIPLGYWVLETACRQLKSWSSSPETSSLQIAVNVSARQFRDSGFTEGLRSVLNSTQIDPSRLKLELTESAVFHEEEPAIAKMHEIIGLGVSFALDDFGTGYSSLSHLKRLPLQQVKIDQSFVRDITTDSNDEAIVRAIIAMAQALDIELLAEGVETQEQFEFLKTAGCFKYQGFLFGKPMPIEVWPNFLKNLG